MLDIVAKFADKFNLFDKTTNQTTVTNDVKVESLNIPVQIFAIQEQQGKKNLSDYKEELNKLLSQYNIPRECAQEKLKDPEVYSTFNKADATAYKTSLAEKKQLLASLMCGKFTCENADISQRSIVFSRAIEAMESLTIDSIRMLAFVSLFVSNHVKDKITLNNFEQFYDDIVAPLIQPIDKQQLRFCASMLISLGLTYRASTWAVPIAAYLPNDLVQVENKYKSDISNTVQDKLKCIEEFWVSITGDCLALSPVGKCIGRSFLICTMQYIIPEDELSVVTDKTD